MKKRSITIGLLALSLAAGAQWDDASPGTAPETEAAFLSAVCLPPDPPERKPQATAVEHPFVPDGQECTSEPGDDDHSPLFGAFRTWVKTLSLHPEPEKAKGYVSRLKQVFEEEGVPPELAWIAEVESSFNPMAESSAGALGLFQFMPVTAERFGLLTDAEDGRTDPERSARAAARYLRVLHGEFEDWPLAVAAYNAGEGRVNRTLQRRGARTLDEIVGDLPAQTRNYVPKVMATLFLREGVTLSVLPPPRA